VVLVSSRGIVPDVSSATVHVALLRGINVGGRNKLPMKELASLFRDAGSREVETYIQSGNVVFEAEPALADRIAGVVSEAIRRDFGLDVPVVTRTEYELARVVDTNPFLEGGGDESILHVAFLADLPDADRVRSLDPNRSPPDEFAVAGREIYLRCPNGMARTKLTNAYFDSRLATVSTMRNWRTVSTLLTMASDRA